MMEKWEKSCNNQEHVWTLKASDILALIESAV